MVGNDHVFGGAGNDTTYTNRGQVDVITDATAAAPNGPCETVQRKKARASDSNLEDAQARPKETISTS